MKFILLTHERELLKSTNTGRLVKEALGEQTHVIVWKRKEPDPFLVNLLATKRAALLFPNLGRESIVTEQQKTCIANVDYLVILDATWQEARKMFNRSPYLNQAQRVMLAVAKPSEFILRRNQIVGGLSTAECVIELLRLVGEKGKLKILEEMFSEFNVK